MRAGGRRAADRASPPRRRSTRSPRRAPPRRPRCAISGVEPASAGRHCRQHLVLANRGDDLEPVRPQIRFAADDRDLTRPDLGELLHEIEALSGRELVRSRLARAGAAMATREIALQRDLPDRDERTMPLLVWPRLGERQITPRGAASAEHRQERARAAACDDLGAFGGRERVLQSGGSVAVYAPPVNVGIDRILANPDLVPGLMKARVGLLAHPASVTRVRSVHALPALRLESALRRSGSSARSTAGRAPRKT